MYGWLVGSGLSSVTTATVMVRCNFNRRISVGPINNIGDPHIWGNLHVIQRLPPAIAAAVTGDDPFP